MSNSSPAESPQDHGTRFSLRVLAEARPHLLVFVFFAALLLLAYANTLNNTFVLDDDRLIVKNLFVQNFEVSKFFTTGYWAGYFAEAEGGDNPPVGLGGVYRPFALITYSLNYLAGGLNPFGYHLVNLLLHLSVSFVVYLLALQLGASRAGALVGATLFLVHPIHTEAVAAIYGRPELLMSLGVLGGLSSYIAAWDFGKHSSASRLWRKDSLVAVSLGSFVIGLLSKEQAVMLPPLMVIYDLGKAKADGIGRFIRAAIPRYGLHAALVFFYIAARIAILGFTAPARGGIAYIDNPLAHVSWDTRLLTAVKIAGRYLWLCLWPDRLAMDYSYDSLPMVSSMLDAGVFGAIFAWTFLIGLGLWAYLRGRRLILAGVSLTIVTFFPASNILVPIGTMMGERLFYLPSAGLALLAAAGWDRLAGPARAAIAGRGYSLLWSGLAAAVLVLTARTVARNYDWRSDEAISRSALPVVPRNAKVLHNLGLMTKEPEKALEYFERSRDIYPAYVKDHARIAFQHGMGLLRVGRVDEAVDLFESAARKRPKTKELFSNLGFAYMKQERWNDAEQAYRKAIALNLRDARLHNNLGFVLWKQERYAEALDAAEFAVRLKPDYPEAHYNRGAALESMGKLKEAAAAYEQVLKLKPTASAERRLQSVERRLSGNGSR